MTLSPFRFHHWIGCAALAVNAVMAGEPVTLNIDFAEVRGTTSPYVFGATQPRNLNDAQWDVLKTQGFNFTRSQADLTRLVPAESPEAYLSNEKGCADPANWDWRRGIYGNNFVQQAIDRGMRVCLVIKNARWNRYPGAPDDEETPALNLDVWADVLTKIVNHYEGNIDYIELYNEVDRDPQLRIEGSHYSSRREAYRDIFRSAIDAVKRSNHPDTRLGGPASAAIGLDEMEWLLSERDIREGLGFVSFHAFDDFSYPSDGVASIKRLLRRYDMDIPIIRSSFTPERDDPSKWPGTLEPAYVAQHLIGALRDGLDAAGLWEIQPKEGGNDTRYWFEGSGPETVVTSNLYVLMSKTLRLGAAPARVVELKGSPGFPDAFAGINAEDQKIVILTSLEESVAYELKIAGLGAGKSRRVEIIHGDRHGDGINPNDRHELEVSAGRAALTVVLPPRSVAALLLRP